MNDLESAARDLDEALLLVAEWAAAHFERGKVWLRVDDMEAAAPCFREAARLLPGFGGAWGNLGATLGELDRPAEALQAFERLLALDPSSPRPTTTSGSSAASWAGWRVEAALQRVIDSNRIWPLAITIWGTRCSSQGRYHADASAYPRGQGRDPENNPVQGTRLALCRLAKGDACGALAELCGPTAHLPMTTAAKCCRPPAPCSGRWTPCSPTSRVAGCARVVELCAASARMTGGA